MKIRDYIQTINYSYFETYSLLRGVIKDHFYAKTANEISDLKEKISSPKLGWYSQTKRLAELEKYYNSTQYIIDGSGNLHPTSERKATIQRNEKASHNLLSIVHDEFEDSTDF